MENSNIKIRKVSGNITISQNQKGGITSHSTIANFEKRTKSFFENNYILLIGVIASILGILSYFGYEPLYEPLQENNNKHIKIIDTIKTNINTSKTKNLKCLKKNQLLNQ